MRTTKPIGLVDGDMLVYLGGFAAQKTHWVASWEDEAGTGMAIFDSKKELLAAMEGREYETDKFYHAEPIEFALQIVKNKLVEMDLMCSHLEVYIRGTGNYRDSIATLNKYKGNRTADKPVHYEQIRQYMIDHWDAQLVHGKEADDQVATRARQLGYGQVLCCHADKDLDQIPGQHWNYQKGVHYSISEDEALLFFYQQTLSGDYSDNVKGCWKIGAGKASAIVNEVFDNCEASGEDLETALWARVVQEYEASMGIDGCEYAGCPPELPAIENARLVWMQDEPLRLWTPPGWPLEYLEAGLDD